MSRTSPTQRCVYVVVSAARRSGVSTKARALTLETDGMLCLSLDAVKFVLSDPRVKDVVLDAEAVTKELGEEISRWRSQGINVAVVHV